MNQDRTAGEGNAEVTDDNRFTGGFLAAISDKEVAGLLAEIPDWIGE
jgi:hypothetical protein